VESTAGEREFLFGGFVLANRYFVPAGQPGLAQVEPKGVRRTRFTSPLTSGSAT
jgi:hypothetical protein